MQENQPVKIAMIGLGNMGRGMCATLLRQGYEVWGTDIDTTQRQEAAKLGVIVTDDIASLCPQNNLFILSLPKAQHVAQVVTGVGGLLTHMPSGSIVMDTSTSKPEMSQKLAQQLRAQGHAFLDSPVSGGPVGAHEGTMVMLVGGDEDDLPKAEPILAALSKTWVYLGDSGSGHAAKLINNLLCAAHLLITAEAVAIGRQAGLDTDRLLTAINAGSGRSGISEVNFPKWITNNAYDSGFTMGLMRKDLNLAGEFIANTGLKLPMSQEALHKWQTSVAYLTDEQDFNQIVTTVPEADS